VTVICAKFGKDLSSISKVIGRKTKWPRFFGLPCRLEFDKIMCRQQRTLCYRPSVTRVNRSKTVEDTAKVTIDDLHVHFWLTRSMTLNCYKFEFTENFAGFRRFGRQQQLNKWWSQQSCNPLNVLLTLCSLRWFAVDFFARGLRTRTAVARLP